MGKVAIIHRDLYGGNIAGRNFRDNLRYFMGHLELTLCLANPDVWMRPSKKKDGYPYYECILIYNDDALVIRNNVEAMLRNDLGC